MNKEEERAPLAEGILSSEQMAVSGTMTPKTGKPCQSISPYRPDEASPQTPSHETFMMLVGQRFTDHFGDLGPFGWAVTREDALEALRHFITSCLPQFGDYQDAMKSGEDMLFHAVLSPYINIGLLGPGEVCAAALDAYKKDAAPLQAVEGFIRQILGWREYVRGIYWLQMPSYAQTNFFNANRPLPEFYWTGETAFAG